VVPNICALAGFAICCIVESVAVSCIENGDSIDIRFAHQHCHISGLLSEYNTEPFWQNAQTRLLSQVHIDQKHNKTEIHNNILTFLNIVVTVRTAGHFTLHTAMI